MRFVKVNLPKLAVILALLVAWLFARSAQAGSIRDRLFAPAQSSCANGQCAASPRSVSVAVQVAPVAAPVAACASLSVDATVRQGLFAGIVANHQARKAARKGGCQ